MQSGFINPLSIHLYFISNSWQMIIYNKDRDLDCNLEYVKIVYTGLPQYEQLNVFEQSRQKPASKFY